VPVGENGSEQRKQIKNEAEMQSFILLLVSLWALEESVLFN
jgi:hypothetical protein